MQADRCAKWQARVGLPTEVTPGGRNLGKRELGSRTCGHAMLSIFLVKLLQKEAQARISQEHLWSTYCVPCEKSMSFSLYLL